jgi:DNA primase
VTNLDQPLFDGAGATKRDLVDYLDAIADRLLPVLEDRPLSVIRVHRGQEAFMQKNVPKYTEVRNALVAEASKWRWPRPVRHRRTLWFNQRAVSTTRRWSTAARARHHLVLDLDPPDHDAFSMAVRRPPVAGAGDLGWTAR